MGWWSCTVMGGDTPLDMQADLIEAAGTDYSYFQETLDFDMTALKDDMHRRLGDMIMYCEAQSGDDRNIAFQVFGAITMEAGVTLPDSVRTKIIDGARFDEWAESSDERKAYMKSFILQVEQYEDKPTEIASEGLFEKFAEMMDSGKLHLVNKS